MVNRISAAIGLIAVMGGLGDVANARTPSVSEDGKKTVAIDHLVRGEMTARGIPGLQLAIVQHGKVVFTGVYGQANVENAVPVTEQTIFSINSMSKAFAGVAAMQLVEAGKLDLDAPLTTYLQGLPSSWSGITVRQVLTHTSGLPEIIDDNVRLIDGATPDAAWAKVQELPLKYAPGEKFDYSQTNYVAMDKIIAKLAGKSFSDFVRDRQFNLAGMKRSGFGDPAHVTAHTASLYTYLKLQIQGTETVGAERSKDLLSRTELLPEYMRPAGGIKSTATDLAKWAVALQKLKFVNKASLEQLWTPQPQKDGTYRGFDRTINGYGLGWPSARRTAHPAITPVGGARAAMFIYPNDDLTVIVLTNLMGASPQAFIDKIAAIYIPDLIDAKK